MRVTLLLAGSLLVGCPSGSVAPDDRLVDLDVDTQRVVCGHYAFDAPVFETCGAPIPVRLDPQDAATCVEAWMPRDEACLATVSDWDACQDALAADPCRVQSGTAACDVLEDCGVHLWSSALGMRGDTAFRDMLESEILAICDVTNDFEPFEVTCEDDEIPDMRFEPSAELCASFGFGGCGDIGQVLDCQLDLLTSGQEACDGLPPSCAFDDC
jgi:hypothetical protein